MDKARSFSSRKHSAFVIYNRMKILYIRQRRNGLSYYNEPLRALRKIHEVYEYAPPEFNPEHSIGEVLGRCPFRPELIVFGYEWLTKLPPKSKINVANLTIPCVGFLNKEYSLMDKKLSWICENRLAMFFTAVKPRSEWEALAGARGVHLPFGVNTDMFTDHKETRTYDVGFSGMVHGNKIHDPAGARERMVSLMKNMTGIRFYHGKGYKRKESKYVRNLNSTKIWLSSPGPLHYVGTRYLETMASGALLFCSSIPSVAGWEYFEDAYDGLLEDGQNCVIVDCDLFNFEEKIRFWLQSDPERRRVIDNAKRTAQNHTWDHRAATFTEHVRMVI